MTLRDVPARTSRGCEERRGNSRGVREAYFPPGDYIDPLFNLNVEAIKSKGVYLQ